MRPELHVEAKTAAALRQYRRFAMLAFYATATWATATVNIPGTKRTELLLAVASACAAVMACVVDSLLRGRYLQRSLQWITFFSWPIALPIYLVTSRGKAAWRPLLKATLGVVLAVILGFTLNTVAFAPDEADLEGDVID